MKVVELIGEIKAHEMNVLDISEKPTTSNSIAFKTNAKKSLKLKMIKQETSSSKQEDSHESSTSDEDDDQELELLMRKFLMLSNKIGKKGYIFDPKKRVFRPSGSDKNKICYNCGEKGHISPNCFKPVKKRSSSKNKQIQESSDDEEDNHKGKNKSYEKKRSYYKKIKLFPKKKRENMRSFVVGTQKWVTDVSSSEDSSDEDDIVGVALIDLESPLPPPPMCLMAKVNSKVYDGESDDEELDPNEFSNLIHEYTCIIKRKKDKVKKLESAHASFESSQKDLLAKYNALLQEHDESLVLFK
jgi:hypothetical protein